MTRPDVREAALALLWAMNEYQAESREGVMVVPTEVAHYAYLEPGSDLYDAAVWHLIKEGAIVEDTRYSSVVGTHPGGTYFTLTRRGLGMLRER